MFVIFCSQITMIVLIPPDAVGPIIGKGGSGLKTIREASMTQLDVNFIKQFQIVQSKLIKIDQTIIRYNEKCVCLKMVSGGSGK